MHLDYETLARRLRELPPQPTDEGRVTLVVAREPNEGRRMLDRHQLTPEGGVEGDRWSSAPNANPAAQITVMRTDVARLFGEGQPISTPGDNLMVELDLSTTNLPTGTRLRVGTALCEVTPQPHTGCAKFARRYGQDARDITGAADFANDRLRGIYIRVIEAGDVGAGDRIQVLSRPK